MKTIAFLALFVCACSSAATPAPASSQDSGQPEASVTPGGEDSAVPPGDDSAVPNEDAGEDAADSTPPADADIDSPIIVIPQDSGAPHDAGSDGAPDKTGIWCNTTALGLVIGCDGTLPQTGAVETAAYTCPADGSGTASCSPGTLCEAVEVAGGVNHYYPGTCE